MISKPKKKENRQSPNKPWKRGKSHWKRRTRRKNNKITKKEQKKKENLTEENDNKSRELRILETGNSFIFSVLLFWKVNSFILIFHFIFFGYTFNIQIGLLDREERG